MNDDNKMNKVLDEFTSSEYKYGFFTDIETDRRAIRAIEIEKYYAENPQFDASFPEIKSLNVGIDFDRELRRQRITTRLKQRLDEGMLDAPFW